MLASDLQAYARDVAPHVDRLAVAVHRHARQAAPAVLRAFNLTNAGVLIDARPLLLAGPITVDDLATIERYAPRAGVASALEQHVEQGLLAREGVPNAPRYAPTGRGLDLLLRLTALQGETITALWSAHADELPVLLATSDRAVEAATALPPDRYPAFRLQRAAPDPQDATPATLLLARLTALRYLRADAHASAWAAAGLDAPQIGALTALWRDTEPAWEGADIALEHLRQRGSAAYDGTTWHLTDQGVAVREAIEADTDMRAAPPWTALSGVERTALLHGLARLPD